MGGETELAPTALSNTSEKLFRFDPRQVLHFAATAALFVAGIPLCRWARLEVRGPITLLSLVPAIAAQGISFAAVLFAIQYPSTVLSTLKRGDRKRFLILVPVVVLLFYIYGPLDGAMFTIGALAITEYLTAQTRPWVSSTTAILLPAAYCLIGFGVVYELNDVIVTFRYFAAYDPVFLRIDRWLLFGGSVTGFRHWAQAQAGSAILHVVDRIYYANFAQVGAGIVICALTGGMSKAFRIVGTFLVAYYLTLVCFFLWPSHGPYAFSADHFVTFPKTLNSYHIQQVFLENARALWHHTGILISTGGYYISFPSMHIAQPLIVLWFLRSYKRIVVTLLAFDAVLIPAILLLEWHYAVDLLGGAIITVIAIWLVGDRRMANIRGAAVASR